MVNKMNVGADRSGDAARLRLRVDGDRPRKPPFTHDYAEADIIRLSAFFRDNPVPILVCCPDGDLIKLNPAAERLLKRFKITATDLLTEEHKRLVQRSLAGQIADYTCEVSIGNYRFSVSYHALPTFRLVYLYVIDMTEYRRIEELLQAATETLGVVTHAIKQLQEFSYWQSLNLVELPDR